MSLSTMKLVKNQLDYWNNLKNDLVQDFNYIELELLGLRSDALKELSKNKTISLNESASILNKFDKTWKDLAETDEIKAISLICSYGVDYSFACETVYNYVQNLVVKYVEE